MRKDSLWSLQNPEKRKQPSHHSLRLDILADGGPVPARLPRQTGPAGKQARQGLQVHEGPAMCLSTPVQESPPAITILQWKQDSLLIREVSVTDAQQSIPFCQHQTLKMLTLNQLSTLVVVTG